MRRFLGAAIALVAALGACRPARDPLEVRLGYAPNLTHAQALVGLARGDLDKALPAPYRLAATPFNAGPAMIEALFAGEIDLAYLGPAPAVNGFLQSGGRAIRIIAGSSSGGSALVVREGAGIGDERNLQGRGIAVPQFGGTQDVALRTFLRKLGLKTYEHGGDVRVLAVPNPEILVLFKKGQLDAAMVPEPWVARLEAEARGRILVDERTLWPGGRYTTTLLIARTEFLQRHPEAARRFVDAHVGLTEWVAANPKEAVGFIREQVKAVLGKPLPEAIVARGLSRVEVTVDPLPVTVREDAKRAWQLGYLKHPPRIEGIMDLRLVNEVLGARGLARVSDGGLGPSASLVLATPGNAAAQERP